LCAAAQYLFIRYQLKNADQLEYKKWAKELKQELNYTTKWDLKKFRQADWEAPASYIFTKNGHLIDIYGFVPGLIGQVTLPTGLNYNKTITITSEIGEKWRVLSKRVTGGIVILGILQTDAKLNVDEILRGNMKEFGNTLDDAIKVRPRNVNTNTEYCVIDDNGRLQWAIGGIPLRLNANIAAIISDSTIETRLNGKYYSVYSTPILDVLGNIVGSIIIPKDNTLRHQTINNALIFNIIIAIVSWIIVGILSAIYFLRYEAIRRISEAPIEEIIKQEESDTLEFKSSLRWDHINQRVNNELGSAVIKTVAAFLNTLGGVLVIGIANDKKILGLELDYNSLHKDKQNRDGFQLHLQDLLSPRIGVDRYQSNVKLEFKSVEGKDICVLRVKQAPKPVVVQDHNLPVLYVRAGNATKILNVVEALRYVKEHWNDYI
jgi:hypothetical protein